MSNVSFIQNLEQDGTTTIHALIDHGNGSFTSMPKAVYDAQVEHLTEIVPNADEL